MKNLKPTSPTSETRVLWIICAILAFLAVMAVMAQEFRINVTIGSDDKLHLRYPADPNYYYILSRGDTVTNIVLATGLALGEGPQGELADPVGAVTRPASFYRIRKVPIAQPLDTDGDGIDDVWELGLPAQLNPLNASDAQLPSAGPGSQTWKQAYDNEQSASQLPVAYFPELSSTVLADAADASVRVAFSKPFTGRLRYQLSGTAIPPSAGVDADFEAPPGFVDVAGANTATIRLILIPRGAIENDRSILVALSVPAGANVDYRTADSSVHELKILQGDRGVFIGTLSITNGLLLGSVPVKMALRIKPNGIRANFDVNGDPLLGDGFTVAASDASPGLQFTDSYSRQLSNTPFGRPVRIQVQFGVTQSDQNSLATPVTIAVDGLTGSGRSVVGAGVLRLTKAR
jgi:hypothetical protein